MALHCDPGLRRGNERLFGMPVGVRDLPPAVERQILAGDLSWEAAVLARLQRGRAQRAQKTLDSVRF